MASNMAISTFCFLFFFVCSLHGAAIAGSPKKSIHLTYYAQEYRGGPNNTLLSAAGTGQGNMSAIGWGTFLVVDNILKAGPYNTSDTLGSITGTATVTSKGGIGAGGVQIVNQHIFNSASKYAGSSLTVIGTISTPFPPYEVNFPGGTGAFRHYSGYGILTPQSNYTAPPFYVYEWDVYLTYKK